MNVPYNPPPYAFIAKAQQSLSAVKAFVRARHEVARFHHANDSLMEQNLLAVRTTALTMPLMMLLLNLGVVTAIWLGGVRVTAGTMQIGRVAVLPVQPAS